MMKTRILALTIILAFLPVGSAFAHKVIVFAWVEEGMIHTESHFGSKRKAGNAPLEVYDEKGTLVHTGTTDDKGVYSFAIPEKIHSDLVIKLMAGDAHKAEWRIPISELTSNVHPTDIQNAMETKARLEKGPGMFKIFSGILIIFLLALLVKYVKGKTAIK